MLLKWGQATDRYDSQGNRVEFVRYNGAGPDGVFFTDDDVEESLGEYNVRL